MKDARATLDDVSRLRETGALPFSAYWPTILRIRGHKTWRKWGSHTLLSLGCAHIIIGIFLFFAANWAVIPAMGKLLLVGLGILAPALTAHKIGFDKLVGQALFIGASAMVGVWLVVFSQIYQTGADAYTLFLSWAVLISAWTFMSRSQALWLFWAILLILALWLYAFQIYRPAGLGSIRDINLSIAGGLLGFLAMAEGLFERGHRWLTAKWGRVILCFLTIAHIDFMAIRVFWKPSLGAYLVLPVAVVLLALLTFLYWKKKRGFEGLILTIFGWTIFAIAGGMRVCAELLDDWAMFLTMGLWCSLCVAICAWYLTRQQKIRGASHG